MQKSENNQTAPVAHRQVQPSTTLNRKYVRRVDGIVRSSTRPAPVQAQPKVQPQSQVQVQTAQRASSQQTVAAKSVAPAPHQTAEELKKRAIEKALQSASKSTSSKKAKKKSDKFHFGFGRVVLALACTAAAVFAIVYFVNLNMPDLPLRVAAMQTGINASYPSYIPRDFSLSDITSEDGKITLNFKNATEGDAFGIVEEKSSWDSSALLNNYVKATYGDNYTTVREQGLTLYISGSNATWVNGGIVFKLTTTSGSLTKKQIKSIAVSL